MPSSSRKSVLCRYHYDPLDRQNGCTVLHQPAIQHFHCKRRLATEIQGAARWSIIQHDDQLLAQQNHLGSKVITTLLATNQQRSILNAIDATQLNPLAYTPYGHRPAENGLLSLLGFNGERTDPVTGHYHLGNGYRQFNAVLMRFNSPDSWSPFGEGGINSYTYCLGDPVNGTDRSGHTAFFIKRILRALGLMKKSTAKEARNVLNITTASTDTLSPPPLNSSKTVNELTSRDLIEPDFDADLFKLSSPSNARHSSRLKNPVAPTHKGKHFPPEPSPSIFDGVNTDTYTKNATTDQIFKDHADSKAILDAYEGQPSTSKALQSLNITQNAIDLRFAH